MPASDPGARPANLPSLTALRAFAALAVFGFHAAGLLSMFGTGRLGRAGQDLFGAGPTGVSFFFILSGFVLTWSRRRTGARTFWQGRAARILPAYLAAWVFSFCVLTALGHRPPAGGSVASFFLVQVWTSNPDVLFAVNIVAWSLAVEAVFYLLFPLVLPYLLRLAARRRPLVMVGLGIVPITLAVIQQAGHGSSGYLWLVAYFPLARLPEFLIGALLALEIRERRWRHIPLLPAAFLAVGAYLLAGQVPAAFMWVAVTLVPYVLLIAAAAQSDLLAGSGLVVGRAPLRHRVLDRLGVWSYSFYLLQVPVGLFVARYWHPLDRSAPAQIAGFLGYAAVTWIAAALLYRCVEKPVHTRLFRRAPVAAPIAAPSLEQAAS
jgi:peptidoglycan/LPS O-acetylase OafA/YrhL